MLHPNTVTTNADIPSAGAEPPPLGELVGRLTTDLQQLVRREAALATHELGKKLDYAKLQVATLGIGLALLVVGALALVASAILGLALLLPAWAAALCVGGAFVTLGLALVYTGKSKLARFDPRPEKAITNIERDVAAVKGAAT